MSLVITVIVGYFGILLQKFIIPKSTLPNLDLHIRTISFKNWMFSLSITMIQRSRTHMNLKTYTLQGVFNSLQALRKECNISKMEILLLLIILSILLWTMILDTFIFILTLGSYLSLSSPTLPLSPGRTQFINALYIYISILNEILFDYPTISCNS